MADAYCQTMDEFATVDDLRQVTNMMASARKEIMDLQYR